jgi:hypothetical protein
MRAFWKKWRLLLIPLILYSVGITYTLNNESDWTAKQTWAIILTGFILIWYTWETMFIRHLASLQREGQLRPFVVFRKEDKNYVVENIGNGAALDVRIDSITIKAPNIQLDIAFPQSVPLLKPNAIVEIKAEVLLNGKKSDSAFAAHLDPQHAIIDVDVHIRFKNIEGKNYELVEIIAPKTVSIKGFRDEQAL